MSNWISAVGRMLRTDASPSKYEWMDRIQTYDLYDAYYSNTVYQSVANGGQRDYINADLGNAAAADLGGLYNPISAVVDLYMMTFNGAFGDEIIAVSDNAALLPALERVWKWSNLTIEKQPLCRLAATHGTVGLRIVARNHADATKRRVYIKAEHPRTIRAVELDDRGNVEAIQLEYDRTYGLAEDMQVIRVRETITKEEFSTERVIGNATVPFDVFAGIANGEKARYPNDLGVVPYVLLRHEHTGDTYGRNAFYKAREPIDRLNALMSHIDVQIHRHVKAKWFIAAAGAAPTEIDMSDLTVAYSDTRNASGSTVIQPLVAPLDLAGAIAQSKMQMNAIEDMLPELKATQGAFLSGQSGETIAELRKPAEDKLSLARMNYEDALVRAQQIALSWGVLLSLWDLGTGQGDRAAADRAFNGGYEDHVFNKRPLLTPDAPAMSAADAVTQSGDAPNA